MTYMCVYMHI